MLWTIAKTAIAAATIVAVSGVSHRMPRVGAFLLTLGNPGKIVSPRLSFWVSFDC